ncbi:MAG: DUF371 domain-containing protein [Candidatus Hadarchaeales archaeon]
MKWIIRARGHPNITAKHPTTFMFTMEKEIGPRADCVVGVQAETGAAGLDQNLKKLLKSGATVKLLISCGGVREEVLAKGHPSLSFDHPTDIVVRKSSYTCGRTIAILADKGAADFSRELVEKLQHPNEVLLTIEILL